MKINDLRKVDMMKTCECGCGKIPKKNNNFIHGHNSKFIKRVNMPSGKRHHAWKGGQLWHGHNRRLMVLQEYHPRINGKGYIFDHILKAEIALGKYLPENAVVHHHTLNQLVICQNQAYHLYLHLRQRALKACGHPHWRKCFICQKWDDPQNLYIDPNSKKARHRACHAKSEYDRRHGK